MNTDFKRCSPAKITFHFQKIFHVIDRYANSFDIPSKEED